MMRTNVRPLQDLSWVEWNTTSCLRPRGLRQRTTQNWIFSSVLSSGFSLTSGNTNAQNVSCNPLYTADDITHCFPYMIWSLKANSRTSAPLYRKGKHVLLELRNVSLTSVTGLFNIAGDGQGKWGWEDSHKRRKRKGGRGGGESG